jgi:acetyl-CoA C-acetyltransferase/acetyl-CoA acyltransferase
MNLRKVAIVDGVRTPFAKAGDLLMPMRAQDLGQAAFRELCERLEIGDGFGPKARVKVDEVIIGNVGSPVDASNVARVIAMNAGLHKSIPSYSVNRNCASGMEAISQAYLRIATGNATVLLVGGAESMSNLPLLFNKKMTRLFGGLMRAKSLGQKLGTMATFRPDFLSPIIAVQEALKDPFCGLNMGQTADLLAREFEISREEQDRFAINSHEKAVNAQEAGRLREEIVPLPIPPQYKQVVQDDIGPRRGLTLEKMAKFPPYFDRINGTVTIANACPITDGAVALAMMPLDFAKEHGFRVLGTVKAIGAAGLEPERMGLGPAYAMSKVLRETGMKISDMDFIEVNEAFSAQVLAVCKAVASKKWAEENLGLSEAVGAIDPDRLNVNGGAVALGHPVGASGARIALTALKQLRRSSKQFAMASLCIGGGQGQAVILERGE